MLARDSTLLVPQLIVGELDTVSRAVGVLSWIVDQSGPILLAAQCRTEEFQSVILAVTDDQIVVTPIKKLLQAPDGAIDLDHSARSASPVVAVGS